MPGQRRSAEAPTRRGSDPVGDSTAVSRAGLVAAALSALGVAVAALLTGAGALGAGTAVAVLLACQLHTVRRPHRLYPADAVTMLRGCLLALLAAHLALGMPEPSLGWAGVLVAAVMLLLDGVDGIAARRWGGSEAGARYDVATDAVVVLVLSAAAAAQVGWWVLAVGLLDPLFRLGRRLRPRWRAELPVSVRRRVCGALPAPLMIAVLSPVSTSGQGPAGWWQMPTWGPPALAGIALILLLVSYAADVRSLERGADDQTDR